MRGESKEVIERVGNVGLGSAVCGGPWPAASVACRLIAGGDMGVDEEGNANVDACAEEEGIGCGAGAGKEP